MSKTRLSIPVNNGVLNILRARVEVSCEPPGVNAHHLSVLLIYGNIGGGGGRRPIVAPTESLHPPGDIIPETGVLSMGRLRIMTTSCSVTVVSPHGRWNVWVFRRHRSTSVINAVESIIGRPSVMRRARGRNPAPHMNNVYRSSHIRRLCMRILSGDSRCGTQQ
jgi:hypothetical protein